MYQDCPTSELLYINCDYDDHSFILHNGKIYDSCWNAYPLTVREAPSVMIDCIKQYKPFTLLRPDGILHEVLDYECYSSDSIEDSLDRIISNYEALINHN